MGTRKRIYKICLGVLVVIYVTLLFLLKYNEVLVGYLCALDFGVMAVLMVQIYVMGLPHNDE
jgi:predicted MFS family arabinose efflux permease